MAEYIEREAALKKLLQCADVYNPECSDITVAHAMRKISAIPAADVVPVVRCRDCKHRDPEDKKCDCGGLEHAHMFPVADDWFCADGEKREVEHD